jgi:hypothetical protein
MVGYENLFADVGRTTRLVRLFSNGDESKEEAPYPDTFWPTKEAIPTWRVPFGMAYVCFGVFVCGRGKGFICWLLGAACGVLGVLFVLGGYVDRQTKNEHDGGYIFQHDAKNVSQKLLTRAMFPYYINASEADMANVLKYR